MARLPGSQEGRKKMVSLENLILSDDPWRQQRVPWGMQDSEFPRANQNSASCELSHLKPGVYLCQAQTSLSAKWRQ